MAVSKRRKSHQHYTGRKRTEDVSELSGRLAPLEELDAETAKQASTGSEAHTIIVDTGKLKLPRGFEDVEQKKRGILSLEPVTLFILVLMLAFIAFIAYLIYLSPAQATK